MLYIDVALFDGNQRLITTYKNASASFGTGENGMQSCDLTLEASVSRSMDLYLRTAASLSVRCTSGAVNVWEGRVEDVTLLTNGVTIQALGRWRALKDLSYTALWSDTKIERWRELTPQDRLGRLNGRFVFPPFPDGLAIALKQGMSYSTATHGSYGYVLTDKSSRGPIGIMCAVEHNLPTTYRFRIVRYSGGFGGTATVVATLNGTGAAVTTAIYANWVGNACDAIELDVDYNNAVATTYAGQDGDNYVRIWYQRVVTSDTNTLSGTLGTTIAAGVRVVTPSTGTAKIYVGQQIYIGHATTPEIVTVTAVTSTTFTATFLYAHANTDIIRAFVIYADEIAKDMLSTVTTTNPGQLSGSQLLIQSPGLDLLDQVFEDADMADNIKDLAYLGDNTGQRYEAGVGADARLYFRPQGSAAQSWYVDASDLQIQQTLDQLANRVIARYESADGTIMRTAPQDDTLSIARYGITRGIVVQADTTSNDLAVRVAQTARDDQSSPLPRIKISLERVYTSSGALAPLWQVRNGDTITIRNLPVVSGLDRVRTFLIAETQYDVNGDGLNVVPSSPLPELEYLLARKDRFGSQVRGVQDRL